MRQRKALLAAADALVAPELARVEVASALIRKGLRQELVGADVRRMLRAWFRMLLEAQIVLLPHEDDLDAAAELALQLQQSLPDCLYLAVAERLGAALITADRQFARRAQSVSERVQLLDQTGA